MIKARGLMIIEFELTSFAQGANELGRMSQAMTYIVNHNSNAVFYGGDLRQRRGEAICDMSQIKLTRCPFKEKMKNW